MMTLKNRKLAALRAFRTEMLKQKNARVTCDHHHYEITYSLETISITIDTSPDFLTASITLLQLPEHELGRGSDLCVRINHFLVSSLGPVSLGMSLTGRCYAKIVIPLVDEMIPPSKVIGILLGAIPAVLPSLRVICSGHLSQLGSDECKTLVEHWLKYSRNAVERETALEKLFSSSRQYPSPSSNSHSMEQAPVPPEESSAKTFGGDINEDSIDEDNALTDDEIWKEIQSVINSIVEEDTKENRADCLNLDELLKQLQNLQDTAEGN